MHSAYGPNGQYGSYYTFLAESNKNVYEEGEDNHSIIGDGDTKMDEYYASFQYDLNDENSKRNLAFLENKTLSFKVCKLKNLRLNFT